MNSCTGVLRRPQNIYTTYIQPNSRSQVNLRESEMGRVTARLTQTEIAKDAFDEACNVCLSMIEYNHFLDFKESKDFKLMSRSLVDQQMADQQKANASCSCVVS
jgi:hypothetical protein